MSRRCYCGRPVPKSSLDGVNCANHDAPAPSLSPAEQAVIVRFDAAPAAPEAAVLTCPWAACPHGADCVHADWQLGVTE